MKILILERLNDQFYCYMENPDQFINMMHSGQRDLNARVDQSVLDSECNLQHALNAGQWISIVINN